MSFTPTFDQSRRYFESRLHGQRIGSRREASVKCPFHDDGTASLSINLERGIWRCFACNVGGGILDFERRLTGKDDATCWAAINETIGREAPKTSKRGQIVATYDYQDAAGTVVFQVVRLEPKDFQQRRPDGKGGWLWNLKGITRVPFNLPALVRANVALIAEGERDALNLEIAAAEFPNENGALSYSVTTNAGGAGNWLDEYSPYLAGKKVFVFQDNDDPGRKHARKVCASVSKYAQEVRLVELPGLNEKQDVSDFLKIHTSAELFELMKAAPVWASADGQQSARAETGLKLVGLAELLSRPVVADDWLLQGRLLAGSLSIVASKPKVGKSTFARGLALAVARGDSFLGWPVKQGPVLYLALEERAEDVAADFRSMGADGCEEIQIADAGTALDVVNILKKKKPVLLVIDPLFRLLAIRDERAYAETYSALGPLIDVGRETGTHILATHHSSKLAKSEAIDSPLGSTALGGAVASLLVMRRKETYRTIETVQRRGEDLPETVLKFNPETKKLSLGGSSEAAEVQDTAEKILAWLGDGSWTEPEITDAVEGRTALLRQAIRGLVDDGRIARLGSGRKGDPYRYQVSRFLVPTPIENNGNKKSETVILESIQTDQKKLVPDFRIYTGNKKTSFFDDSELPVNTGKILVPDTISSASLSEMDGNKLFEGPGGDACAPDGDAESREPGFDWGDIAGSIRNGITLESATDVEGEL